MSGGRDMTVRRAGPEDFEAVAEMWREFDHEVPPPIHEGPPTRRGSSPRWRRSSPRKWRSSRSRTAARSASRWRRRTGALATLTDLYVRQDARRSGAATELMRDVLDAVDALGIEHLDLEVMASNAVARSLYARWGFRTRSS